MSDDPLARFRRREAPPPAVPAGLPAVSEASAERSAYRAFAGKDNQRKARLDIRCADGLAHAVGYSYVVEIAYDRRGYTALALVMTTMLVRIRGRNLRPIVDSLKLGVCEFIQQWNAAEFDPPESDTEPFVDSIEVLSSSQMRENPQKGQGGGLVGG